MMKRLHMEHRTIFTTVLLSVLHTIQKVTYQVPQISSSYLEQRNRARKMNLHSLDRS